MVDDGLIPRPRRAGDDRRAREELERRIRLLDGANRNSSSTIPTGSTLELEGGINVQGGYITVREGGDISAVGEGQDRYTGDEITVTASLGNREVVEPWTGVSVLRPGIWLQSSSYPADPGNLASLTSRYGDNVEIQSLSYDDGAGRRWRSSANIDPAGASIGWSMQDGDPASPTTGGTVMAGSLSVSLDAPMEIGSYARNAAPDDPAVVHTEASLEVGAWGGQLPTNGTRLRYEQYDYNGAYLARGSLRFDKNGLLTLHSEKGSNKVDVTHAGDGVLTLKGSNSVNVEGTFTVNGSPVGGGGVTSVNTRTGDVVLTGTDIPAATTSAPGAMTAADKTKLNGLGTESIVSALSPAGWNIGGSIFVEPLAGEVKITLALVPKYTGANVTITTTAYTSMGTVLPSAAISSTADSPYVLTQVVGAGLNNQAIGFVNLATGAASIRAVGANFTLASGALFTISYAYKR